MFSRIWSTLFGSAPIAIPNNVTMALLGAALFTPERIGELRLTKTPGKYAGRSVTKFRIFDPATTAIKVKRFNDLQFPAEILVTGRLESNDRVYLD
jgi:hypothetical protein